MVDYKQYMKRLNKEYARLRKSRQTIAKEMCFFSQVRVKSVPHCFSTRLRSFRNEKQELQIRSVLGFSDIAADSLSNFSKIVNSLNELMQYPRKRINNFKTANKWNWGI